VKPFNFTVPDLRNFYSQPYSAEAMQWRSVGAADKVANIVSMVSSLDLPIKSVLEVGCGTGGILQELASRNIGATFAGVDIGANRSSEIEEALCKAKITVLDYDGRRLPFEDASFDFVYATHVLEHVTDERGFLLELRRVSRQYVYVEVPCEMHCRTSYEALQSSLLIGHINSYSFRSFILKLETSGLQVIRQGIFDHSVQVHSFRSSKWKAVVKMTLRRSLLALNEDLASQFFTYHAGALCVRSAPLNI
jgi:ubiquinone/menaquinone biosynthesis C-methylase UbiE